MNQDRRATLATLILLAVAFAGSCILGAVQVPTGLNIATAMIITLSLLVEVPITAIALMKHKPYQI